LFSTELNIVETLSFSFSFVHPYTSLSKYLFRQQLPRFLALNAWDIITDSFFSAFLVLRFPPEYIAAFSIFFAAQVFVFFFFSICVVWFFSYF
jgi:hypothetical protein